MGEKEYTVRALYDVIKTSLLLKDRDLVSFIKTMNDSLISDVKKIKTNSYLTTDEIINRYESYSIVYLMVKSILKKADISKYYEKAREITDYLLNDELKKKPEKNSFFNNQED